MDSKTSSPDRLWLGLTVLSLLGLAVVAGLALTGQLRFGAPSPAADSANKKKATTSKSAGGRYRIEPAQDMGELLTRMGKLGVFGEPVQQAWVFKFTGGFLECKLETDFRGQPVSAGTIPDDWPGMLRRDEALKAGTDGALQRDGYIVLAAMQPILSIAEALEQYAPHLGGLFVSGPAGPLHQVTTLQLESWHRRRFRIFVAIGPPQDRNAVWTEHVLPIREPFLQGAPLSDKFETHSQTDLSPGSQATILECQRGLTLLRFKAKFLSDREVLRLANQEREEHG